MKREKTTFRFNIYISFSILVVTIFPNITAATIIATGDVDPAYPGSNPDPWTTNEHIKIGDTSDGSINLDNGSRINSEGGLIGYDTTGNGTVTITGSGSYWLSFWSVIVGSSGDANMVISDGGQVTSRYCVVGLNSNSSGNVTVTGPDSELEIYSSSTVVGSFGDANMLISNGGSVTSTHSYVGSQAGGTGVVTVTGADSFWDISRHLYIGYSGNGSITISDGGYVSNISGSEYLGMYNATYIGYDATGTGAATITGPNSLWEHSAYLYVGYSGDANMVVANGGNVTNTHGYIGFNTGSMGNATVTGADSLWSMSSEQYIGYFGDANMLISDGGQVTDSSGCIGYTAAADGTATITGSNSLWKNSAYLYVGYNGDANMVISDGGNVTNTHGYIGYGANGRGNATITDPCSLWESSGSLFVGYNGDANVLILDGGKVTDANGYIGFNQDNNSSVTITDSGSLWENSHGLYIGSAGDADMLISDSGKVTNENGYIGYEDTGSGIATITGSNSLWQCTANLYIGYAGDANVVISDEGEVTDVNGFIGYGSTGAGSVSVTGSNSLWQSTGNLYVGGSSTGAGGTGLLDVNDSGTVQASNIYIWSTGTVSGDGYLNGNVWNYGTLKPGNSIGTMTIDGDLTMDPNSTLEVEVDNSGNSDLLSVTGDVDIQGGTVKAISTETITNLQQYTIIEADSVAGVFDTLDTALLDIDITNAKGVLGYGTEYVLLQIVVIQFDDPNIARTDNQRNLGRALQKIADAGGNDITTTLQGLETNRQVRNAYDQLCGQTRTQLSTVTVADTGRFMGMVSNGMHRSGFSYSRRSGPLFAMAGPDSTIGDTIYDTVPNGMNFALGNGTNSFGDKMWGFWGRGYGLFGDRDSEDGVPGYQYTVYGTSFGLDYRFNDGSLFGITTGYSESDVDYTLPGNKGDISGTHLGIYAGVTSNDWHFDSILTFSFLEYETERLISLMGQKLTGDFDGEGISGYMEARYDWRNLDSWQLQPLLSFQYSVLNLDRYTETGGSSSLRFGNQNYSSYKGSLGLKMTKELFGEYDDRSAQVQLRGRWLHEFGEENSSVDAQFISNPGAVFKVTDADVSRDSIVLGTGLNSRINEYVQFTIDYDLSLNSDETAHLISAALQYRR